MYVIYTVVVRKSLPIKTTNVKYTHFAGTYNLLDVNPHSRNVPGAVLPRSFRSPSASLSYQTGISRSREF